jgi:hypothetical protein
MWRYQMKKIRIVVTPVKDGEVVTGRIVREANKGGKWSVEEFYDVKSGTPGADREMLLEDNERITIEATPTHVWVADREQFTAHLEEIPEEEPKVVEAHDEGGGAPKAKPAAQAPMKPATASGHSKEK